MRTKLGMATVAAIVGIAGLAAIVHQVRLQEKNEALQRQLAQLPRYSAENQRLSHLLVEAKEAQGSANQQAEELLRLRGEVGRMSQEREESNRVQQAKELGELSALRSEVSELGEEISDLREAVQELYLAGAVAPSAERAPAPNGSSEPVELSIRTIKTQGDSFAEKLKRSVAAQEGETFPEVFGRYLQANGISLTNVAGLMFDERTGRVIVRAPPATLDLIERLTVTLDGGQ